MINPGQMKLIQIVLTNKCNMNCANCSQNCPHVPKDRKYFMSLEQVENALKSLEDYPGHIGFFGGEPTLHPQFEKCCRLMQKYVPVKLRRELWTEGTNYNKHRKIINETFYDEGVAYNEHEKPQPCWHQPNQIDLNEVFNGEVTGDTFLDNKLMWKLIDNCWVQLRWSAAITPMGAYFCEVASAKAYLLGRPLGLAVKPGWWKRPLKDFDYQINAICPHCSMGLPMPQKANDHQQWDDMSKKNLDIYKNFSPKIRRKQFELVNLDELRDFLRGHSFEPDTEYQKRGWFKDFQWTPNIYRLTKKHTPEDTERG